MTVRDLIIKLLRCDLDSEVRITFEYDSGFGWGTGPIKKVEKVKHPIRITIINAEEE